MMSKPPSGWCSVASASVARPTMTAAQVLPRRQAELDVDIGQAEIGVEQQHALPCRASACARVMANQVLPTPPLPEAMAMVRGSRSWRAHPVEQARGEPARG